MGPFWLRTSGRIARLFGLEVVRRRAPAEACLNLMCEMRQLQPGIERDAQDFLRFCFERLGASRGELLQDLFVLYETGEKRGGYFVEFGAADGIRGSNSYILETEHGWNGIVAEPARIWHKALKRNRRCIVDLRCVAGISGERLTFRQCRHPELSTIDSCADNDRFGAMREPVTRYPVETVSLNDLLKQHGAPRDIDYLSVDTEGSEPLIFGALDFNAYRPRIITVEHCHSAARDQLFALLSGHGYRRKFESLSQIEDWYVLA